jgi:hypothetical protein
MSSRSPTPRRSASLPARRDRSASPPRRPMRDIVEDDYEDGESDVEPTQEQIISAVQSKY